MKKQRLKRILSLCLAVLLLSTGALAADETGESLLVGGVELVGSADQPAYAVTDSSGTVTPGGSESSYNLKWDGTKLTLRDANIVGRYVYDADQYESASGIYRMGSLEIDLIGANTVTCPAPEGTDSTGIYVEEGTLEFCGSGSLDVWGSYEGIANKNGGLTIAGGKLNVMSCAGGIGGYNCGVTITGGEVTIMVDGNYVEPLNEETLASGFYVQGDFNLSGGSVSVKVEDHSENISTAWGVYVYGSEHFANITGGTLTASVDDGDAAAIFASGGVNMSGGSVTASNPAEDGDGIHARIVNISGGTLYAEAGFLPIQCTNDLTISGGTVTTNGLWALFSYQADIVIAGGTVTANGSECAARTGRGQVILSPQEGLQLSVSAGDDAASAADIKGSPFRIETEITDLVKEQKYLHCTSSARVASIFVGDQEFTSTDGKPVYAVTDENGTVTPGGSEDTYNVKWDGGTLTLRDATITGSNEYSSKDDEFSACAAILSKGTFELKLVGSSTVIGPAIGSDGNSVGVASIDDLVISGEGSICSTGEYDGISACGGLTVVSGTVVTEGGSSGLSTYEGDMTIAGGDVTAKANGTYRTVNADGVADEYEVAYGIYSSGDCFITGGNVTATGKSENEYTTYASGIFVSIDGSLTVSGGNITACGESTTTSAHGLYSYEDIRIDGGTLTLSGSASGAYAKNDVIVTGGTINSTVIDGLERAYSLCANNEIHISGGTINAQGIYSFNGTSISGGEINSSGYGIGAAFYAYNNCINVSGGTINATAGCNGMDAEYLTISGGTIHADCGQAGVIAYEVNITGGTVNAVTESTEYGAIHASDGDLNISGGTVSAAGAQSALRAPEGEINITTADGREVTACAGESAESAVALEGSPFLEAAVISDLVEGQKYFSSVGAIPFTDVSGYSWYYDAVKYVYANGLMDGTGATTFSPESGMTRAMIWTILARIDGQTITGASWAEDAKAWAMETGVSDGTDPNGLVTREQAVTMLWRFAGEPEAGGDLSAFTDAGGVSEWAENAMAWAVGNGVITGVTDTTLVPQGGATRAQAAAILMRFAQGVVNGV